MKKKIVDLFAWLLVLAFLLWMIAWWPVADRLLRWCAYYPDSLANCQEE